MNLCDYNTIRDLLARHGFHFSKSMGQNFWIDPEVPRRIAEASGADAGCGVLEIGPGIGPLTAELAQRAGKVVAVELDRALLPVLAETMAPYPNVEALHTRYELYLATNGTPEVQNSRIESAGIARYFQNIFISEQMGAYKPSPAFFHACFAAIPDFDAAEAMMVGDSLTSDIRGARNVGLRSCWYNPQYLPPRPDIPADYTIGALPELPPLLERL